ncbi:MAG: Panacea domain-containing protein [Desulfobacterales bacterium]
MKLLYFLDFKHFTQTGKSVTGQNYYAWDFGPVPSAVWKELESGMKEDLKAAVAEERRGIKEGDVEGDYYLYKAKRNFSDDFFSSREMNLLEETAEIFKEATTKQMVDATHLIDTPWNSVWKGGSGKGKHIDYMLSFKCDNLGGLSEGEAQLRKNEIEEINRVFGTD